MKEVAMTMLALAVVFAFVEGVGILASTGTGVFVLIALLVGYAVFSKKDDKK